MWDDKDLGEMGRRRGAASGSQGMWLLNPYFFPTDPTARLAWRDPMHDASTSA